MSKVWGSDLPHVHVLHTHDDIAGVVLECAVEVDNVGRVALVHDAQLSYDAFPYFVFGFNVDDLRLSASLLLLCGPCLWTTGAYLPRHDNLGSGVLNLADCASVSRTQFPQDDQIFCL